VIWRALVVEIIRILWDQGLYRQNPWLISVHKEWFGDWAEWKTQQTMKSVDRQIEKINKTYPKEEPLFTEETSGKTPLGGFMQVKAPWKDES
jgi:hypothetical protein